MGAGYMKVRDRLALTIIEIRILGELRAGEPPNGVSGLAAATGWPRRSVQRALRRLQALGLAEVVQPARTGVHGAPARVVITEPGRSAARAAREALFPPVRP